MLSRGTERLGGAVQKRSEQKIGTKKKRPRSMGERGLLASQIFGAGQKPPRGILLQAREREDRGLFRHGNRRTVRSLLLAGGSGIRRRGTAAAQRGRARRAAATAAPVSHETAPLIANVAMPAFAADRLATAISRGRARRNAAGGRRTRRRGGRASWRGTAAGNGAGAGIGIAAAVAENAGQERMAAAAGVAAIVAGVIARVAAAVAVQHVAALEILDISGPQMPNASRGAVAGAWAEHVAAVAIHGHRRGRRVFVRQRSFGLCLGGVAHWLAVAAPPSLPAQQLALEQLHSLRAVVRKLGRFRPARGRSAHDNRGRHHQGPSHGSSSCGPIPVHRKAWKMLMVFAAISVSGSGKNASGHSRLSR